MTRDDPLLPFEKRESMGEFSDVPTDESLKSLYLSPLRRFNLTLKLVSEIRVARQTRSIVLSKALFYHIKENT